MPHIELVDQVEPGHEVLIRSDDEDRNEIQEVLVAPRAEEGGLVAIITEHNDIGNTGGKASASQSDVLRLEHCGSNWSLSLRRLKKSMQQTNIGKDPFGCNLRKMKLCDDDKSLPSGTSLPSSRMIFWWGSPATKMAVF